MVSIYDPRYSTLRTQLREARLQAGLTQVEAAQALGTNQQYINRCEAGDRRIDFLEVCDFAVLYGMSLESFGAAAGSTQGARTDAGDHVRTGQLATARRAPRGRALRQC